MIATTTATTTIVPISTSHPNSTAVNNGSTHTYYDTYDTGDSDDDDNFDSFSGKSTSQTVLVICLIILLAVLVGFCIVLIVARWRTKEMNKEELQIRLQQLQIERQDMPDKLQ
jgi:hypothetical protein